MAKLRQEKCSGYYCRLGVWTPVFGCITGIIEQLRMNAPRLDLPAITRGKCP